MIDHLWIARYHSFDACDNSGASPCKAYSCSPLLWLGWVEEPHIREGLFFVPSGPVGEYPNSVDCIM